MSDFNIRSDSVDVEQIMKQIRGRIKEKRGVDYTEEQVRELATVRLEKFLDPKNLRSDLLEQFRNSRPPLPVVWEPKKPVELPEPPSEPPPLEPPYSFNADTLYQSHRAPLRWIRRLLAPIFKLFWNPGVLVQVLFNQSQFNLDMLKRDARRKIEFEQGLYEAHMRFVDLSNLSDHIQRQAAGFERSRAEWNLLYYEVLHNLVLETTRNGIEVKNLRMRVEALASRLDFSERRVRALEGVVQYRPEVVRSRSAQGGRPDRNDGRDRDGSRDRQRPEAEGPAVEADGAAMPEAGSSAPAASPQAGPGPSGESTGRRRRRRRRGRRGTGSAGQAPGAAPLPAEDGNGDEDFGEGDELETAIDDGQADDPENEIRDAAGEQGDGAAANDSPAPTDPDQQ